MNLCLRLAATFLVLSTLGACRPLPKTRLPSTQLFEDRDAGYFLLKDLADKEKNVGKIFLVKNTPDSVIKNFNQFAKLFDEISKEMETWKKDTWDANHISTDSPLPYLEQQARKEIESSQTQSLLLHSGRLFEMDLIYSQRNALDYARGLMVALREVEKDEARKQQLSLWIKQLDKHGEYLLSLVKSTL